MLPMPRRVPAAQAPRCCPPQLRANPLLAEHSCRIRCQRQLRQSSKPWWAFLHAIIGRFYEHPFLGPGSSPRGNLHWLTELFMLCQATAFSQDWEAVGWLSPAGCFFPATRGILGFYLWPFCPPLAPKAVAACCQAGDCHTPQLKNVFPLLKSDKTSL